LLGDKAQGLIYVWTSIDVEVYLDIVRVLTKDVLEVSLLQIKGIVFESKKQGFLIDI